MKNCFYVIEKLIARSFFHPLCVEEKIRLDHWQEEAEKHKILYKKIMDDNTLTGSYRLYRNIGLDKAWKRFKREIGYCPVLCPWLRFAALCLLLLTISGVIFFWNEQPLQEQSFKAILPGCSQAILTLGNTSLRYPVNFGKSARVVYLKGEAYFEVASDPERPYLCDNGKYDDQTIRYLIQY